MKKICSVCQQEKELDQFFTDRANKKWGKSSSCKQCRKIANRSWYKTNPNKAKEDYVKRTHKISYEEYLLRLGSQDFQCFICYTKIMPGERETHLDHDHKTGKLRDFLCENCNRGLGQFNDDPNLLISAANYIKKHASTD